MNLNNYKNIDYREILSREFQKRRERNAIYSLRSFARDINLAPSRLSEILNYKQGLSFDKAKEICKALPISKYEKEIFLLSVQAAHTRRKKDKLEAQKKLELLKTGTSAEEVSLEYFKIIEDWYHFAILELTTLKSFQSDSFWIAKKLDIKTGLIESAIKRLLKIGLLEYDGTKLKRSEKLIHTPTNIPSHSIRRYHEQIIDKSLTALHHDNIKDRDFGSVNFKFNKDNLPDIQKKIHEFRRQLIKEFGTEDGDSLYAYSTQFFRLDKDISL